MVNERLAIPRTMACATASALQMPAVPVIIFVSRGFVLFSCSSCGVSVSGG